MIRIVKLVILFLASLAPTVVSAQISAQEFDKPVKNLCSLIDSRTKDPDPDSDFLYMYQKRLSQSAGITSRDSETEAVTKMQKYWKKWALQLTCSNSKFDTPNGSAIKFAISSQFTEFIEDVLFNWKINLNDIDPADGKTLLDYIHDQIDLNKGTVNEITLNKYRERFINAGAKRAKELNPN